MTIITITTSPQVHTDDKPTVFGAICCDHPRWRHVFNKTCRCPSPRGQLLAPWRPTPTSGHEQDHSHRTQTVGHNNLSVCERGATQQHVKSRVGWGSSHFNRTCGVSSDTPGQIDSRFQATTPPALATPSVFCSQSKRPLLDRQPRGRGRRRTSAVITVSTLEVLMCASFRSKPTFPTILCIVSILCHAALLCIACPTRACGHKI